MASRSCVGTEDVIGAMFALGLRGDAERRLAIHRGELAESRDDQADRHGQEFLAAFLDSPKDFGDHLRTLHQIVKLDARWLTDRLGICEQEVKTAARYLLDPTGPRWDRPTGASATNDLVDAQRKLIQASSALGLTNRLLENLPPTLGTGLADLLADVPEIDSALFSARMLCDDFSDGSPLASLQAKIRETRTGLASSAEPSAFEQKILTGLEGKAADLDGTQDATLADLTAEKTALVSRIQRLSQLAADAGEDASDEIKATRKQLRMAEQATQARRAEVPAYPRIQRLREQALAGDLDAVKTIHKYTSVLPGVFPSGLAATIREVCIEALLTCGFASWAKASANIWAA